MVNTMKEQTIQLSKFRTINTYADIFKLQPDELAWGVNVTFNEYGKIIQRAGTVKVGTLPDKAFIFKWNEIRDGNVNEKLIAISGTSLYIYNDTTNTFDEITNTLLSASNWGGIGYINKFIFANGTNIYKLYHNGTSYVVDDISTIQNIPKGTLFTVFQNRIVIAGDGTENIYFSEISNPEVWDVNYFVAMSGKVTAIETVADFLFVGTDRGFYKISPTGDVNVPFKVDNLVNTGVMPGAIREFKAGSVCSLLTDKRIVVFSPYIQSGEQIEDKIGIPIQNLLPNDFSTFKSFCRDEEDNKIFITDNTYTFVLSPNTLGFTIYKEASQPNYCFDLVSMCNYKGYRYYSDSNGNVYKFDRLIFQDDGVDFDVYLDTAIFGGESQEIWKNWRVLYMITNSITNTQINIYRAVNISGVMRSAGSGSIYGSESRLGFARLGNFLLGGVYAQRSKVRLDVSSNGLQLRVEKEKGNTDFQLSDLQITFYIGYRR